MIEPEPANACLTGFKRFLTFVVVFAISVVSTNQLDYAEQSLPFGILAANNVLLEPSKLVSHVIYVNSSAARTWCVHHSGRDASRINAVPCLQLKAYVLCMEWNSTTSSSCSHKSIQFHSVNLLSLREVATMLGPLLALVPRRMTNLYDPAVDPLWPEIEVCCRPCL